MALIKKECIRRRGAFNRSITVFLIPKTNTLISDISVDKHMSSNDCKQAVLITPFVYIEEGTSSWSNTKEAWTLYPSLLLSIHCSKSHNINRAARFELWENAKLLRSIARKKPEKVYQKRRTYSKSSNQHYSKKPHLSRLTILKSFPGLFVFDVVYFVL